MGGLEGVQGAWGYVQGGMGALSEAIMSSATAHGANVFTEKVNPHPPLILMICRDPSIEQNPKFGRLLILPMHKVGLWNQGAEFMQPVLG